MKLLLNICFTVTLLFLTQISAKKDEGEENKIPGQEESAAQPTPPPVARMNCWDCNEIFDKEGNVIGKGKQNCLNPQVNQTQQCTTIGQEKQYCLEEARYGPKGNIMQIERRCPIVTESQFNQAFSNECKTNYFDYQGKNTSSLLCIETCNGALCNDNSTPGQGGLSTGAIIGIVVGSVVAILLLAGLGYYFYSQSQRTQGGSYDPTAQEDTAA